MESHAHSSRRDLARPIDADSRPRGAAAALALVALLLGCNGITVTPADGSPDVSSDAPTPLDTPPTLDAPPDRAADTALDDGAGSSDARETAVADVTAMTDVTALPDRAVADAPDAAREDLPDAVIDVGSAEDASVVAPPSGAWGAVPPAGSAPLGRPFALPAGAAERPLVVVDGLARVWAAGVALARDVAYSGRVVSPFLTVLDRDGGLLGRVTSAGTVTIDSIAADADGAYVAGAFTGAVTLSDTAWDSGGRAELFVARYTQRGERVWAQRLGATLSRGGAALSQTDAGVALLAAFTGTLTAGTRTLSAVDAHLARVDLSRTGAFTGALDLGPASGPLVKGTAITRGGTMVWSGGSYTGVLATFEADGRTRWTRSVTDRYADFDARGIAWLATSGSVAAIDDMGRTLWNTRIPEPAWIFTIFPTVHPNDCALAHHGDTVALACEAEAVYSFASCVPGLFVAETWLDALGRITVTTSTPASFTGFARFGGLGLGPGRACRLRSEPATPASAINPGLDWRLACDGLSPGGCASGFCGACGADLVTDSAHCGVCGRSCLPTADGTAQSCRRGVCVAQTCSGHRADCDHDANNGCEADLATSAAHCGGCGAVCPSGSTCQNGRCCRGAVCADAIWASDGAEGPFAPTRDTTLTAGVHAFTTITVPAGVTVRTTADGVLDLRATGDVRIDGAFDLRGGRGGDGGAGTTAFGGGTAGALGALPGQRGVGPGGGGGVLARDGVGPAPGLVGPMGFRSGPSARCTSTACESHIERVENDAYQGSASAVCQNCAYGVSSCTTFPSVERSDGFGGAIGVGAMLDLAVNSTLRPGSGGGASGEASGAGGGGGGGALRIASPTRIVLNTGASLRADGGPGGAPDGGPGSGGVIVLAAREVRVAAGAVVSAAGGGARGGLGRVRVVSDAALCTLSGSFTPPLSAGCAAASTLGATSVDAWPY